MVRHPGEDIWGHLNFEKREFLPTVSDIGGLLGSIVNGKKWREYWNSGDTTLLSVRFRDPNKEIPVGSCPLYAYSAYSGETSDPTRVLKCYLF